MIRSMSYDDCNQIAIIESDIFNTSSNHHRLLALLENPVFCGFVDDLNGTDLECGHPSILTGYLLSHVIVDEAEILSIAVSSEYQNSGKGKNLLQHFIAFIAAKDVKTICLEVAVDNKVALTLYNSHGFNEFSRRIGYYKRRGGRCDAIKMKLHV